MARTVPVGAQKSPGDYITAALWNAGPKALADFILTLPQCLAYQTSSQSIAASTWTSVALDSTGADTDGGHSNITNNSRYTCQVPGVYWVYGSVTYANNTTGVRAARIAKNGTVVQCSEGYFSQASGLIGQSALASAPVSLVAGDYVELQGFQSSGGSLSTVVNSEVASNLWVFFVHQ